MVPRPLLPSKLFGLLLSFGLLTDGASATLSYCEAPGVLNISTWQANSLERKMLGGFMDDSNGWIEEAKFLGSFGHFGTIKCEHCFRDSAGGLVGPSENHWSPVWEEQDSETPTAPEVWQQKCTAFYASKFAPIERQLVGAVAGKEVNKDLFVFTNDGHSAYNEAQGDGCCAECDPWKRQCKSGLTCQNVAFEQGGSANLCVGENSLEGGMRRVGHTVKDVVEQVVLGGIFARAGVALKGALGLGAAAGAGATVAMEAMGGEAAIKQAVEEITKEALEKEAAGSSAATLVRGGAFREAVPSEASKLVEMFIKQDTKFIENFFGHGTSVLPGEEVATEQAGAYLAKQVEVSQTAAKSIQILSEKTEQEAKGLWFWQRSKKQALEEAKKTLKAAQKEAGRRWWTAQNTEIEFNAVRGESENSTEAVWRFMYRRNVKPGEANEWLMRFQEPGKNGAANEWKGFAPGGNWAWSQGSSPFKFHISIDPKKVEQGGAEIWKVLDEYPNIADSAKTWASGRQAQYGKQFCLRFHTSATGPEVQNIFDKIEQGLTKAGVGIDETGGVNTVSKNITRGKYDRIVPGAKKYPEGFGRFAYRNESWAGRLDETNPLDNKAWMDWKNTQGMKPIAEGVLESPKTWKMGGGLRVFTQKHWDTLPKEEWYNPVPDHDPFKEIFVKGGL